MDAAFESDDLLKLLTDALRRGPGTPQWQQAVQRVADPNTPNRDEYQLLITVRERLESGKPYREVRPGASFTRAVFEKIEAGEEVKNPRRAIAPLLVMLVCLAVLVGAGGVLLSWMSRGSADVAELSSRLFVTPLRQWNFSGSMPSDLDRVGSLTLEVRGDGMRPDRGAPPAFPPVGAVYSKIPVDLSSAACVEAQVNFNDGPATVGIFAGNAAPAATGLGANEVSISCGNGSVTAGATGNQIAPRPLAPGTHTLRLKLSATAAVAEVDGQAVWAGSHSIGQSAVVGIRFTKPARGQEPGIQSLRVLGP